MLDKLMGAFRRKPPTFDLPGRPVTRALLLRAAQVTSENVKRLKAELGRLRPIDEPSDLNGQIDSAACVVALGILADALDDVGRYWPLPGDPLPRDMHVIVAFGYWVVVGIFGPLSEEGYDLDFKIVAAGLVNSLFMMHSPEETARQHRLAGEVFHQIAGADAVNVRQWRENVQKLVRLYLIQFTSDDPTIQGRDFRPLFASSLKSVLSAVE